MTRGEEHRGSPLRLTRWRGASEPARIAQRHQCAAPGRRLEVAAVGVPSGSSGEAVKIESAISHLRSSGVVVQVVPVAAPVKG